MSKYFIEYRHLNGDWTSWKVLYDYPTEDMMLNKLALLQDLKEKYFEYRRGG